MRYQTSIILASVILIANCNTSAMAASTTKKTSHTSTLRNLTPAQKTKLMNGAIAGCRKKYGAMSTVFRIDYYTGTIWCREN